MWMTNYPFTSLFPSPVAACGCATSPLNIYLPLSSILLSPADNAKNLQTHKMYQEAANDK